MSFKFNVNVDTRWLIGVTIALILTLFGGIYIGGLDQSEGTDPQVLQAVNNVATGVGSLASGVDNLALQLEGFQPTRIDQEVKPMFSSEPVPASRPAPARQVAQKKVVERPVSTKPRDVQYYLAEFWARQREEAAKQPLSVQKKVTASSFLHSTASQHSVPSGKIKVIIPSDTKKVWGDATRWKKNTVKDGVAYIDARAGTRLLINGLVGTDSYLDAYEITLVSSSGQTLVLNSSNAGTTDNNNNPNLQYAYVGGKLSLVNP